VRRVKVDDPPGIHVQIRCIECNQALPVNHAGLFTLKTLLKLCQHIYDNDHELVILARRKPEP